MVVRTAMNVDNFYTQMLDFAILAVLNNIQTIRRLYPAWRKLRYSNKPQLINVMSPGMRSSRLLEELLFYWGLY